MKRTDLKKFGSSHEKVNVGIPRRNFLKLLGGGIFIFFQPWPYIELSGYTAEQARSLPKDYNAFLQITEDGMVKCFTGKIEMGQGINTSLAQTMADDLEVSFEKVQMVMGDTDICPWDAGTWGSQTTRSFGPNMRAASAEARGVLMDMAAEHFKVPVSQLQVKDGIITDTKNQKNRISYGQLARGRRIERYLDVKPTPEDHTKFTLIGKPLHRVDSEQKVTGEAKYTGDIKLPGMVYARILRPPSHGAKLTSADTSEAEKMSGVQVIKDGDFIAVLHENHDKADEAVVKIKAEYSFNEMKVNNETIFDWILKADSSANVTRSAGNIDTGAEQSDQKFQSEFHDGYLAHVPIETHTALGNVEGDKLTVWAATQTPFGLQDGLVRELGLPREKVRVITPFVGGGFGGKSAFQQGIEAGRLALKAKKPVMVVWTRDEEFFYDNFHAASVIKINSGMDKSGMIKLWDYHVYYAGTRGADVIYDVPNARTTSYTRGKEAPPVHPFATGPWRAPNNNTNTFARETQIDIMAAAAGIDPLEFRLQNLKDEKMIGCLEAVAGKFGYKPAKGPSGRGIGIAVGTDAGTWVAMMAEVKVDKNTGKVEAIRIVCSQDMGLCVNPHGTLMQMEGCITMALGYTFTEELKFEGGNILDRGLDSYQIPRFSWLPKIECVILDRKDKAPQGGGEPAIITVGAAVANAIFDATGARLYRTPLTPERVLAAIKKV